MSRAPVYLSDFTRLSAAREIVELRLSDPGIGDHAWILERVAVERQDAHEGRLEGEKHARLNLCSPRQTAGLRHDHELFRTEVSDKSRKAGGVHLRRYHSIVIAGDREYRRGIVPIRLVELIVIVLRFTEAVDHVAQQQVKLRHFFGVGFLEIGHHFVGDQVLSLGAARAAAIARRVKHDLARRSDFIDCGRVAAEDLRERQAWFDAAARRRKRQRMNLVLPVELRYQLVGRGVRRMLDLELGRVRRRLRLRKGGMRNWPGAAAAGVGLPRRGWCSGPLRGGFR